MPLGPGPLKTWLCRIANACRVVAIAMLTWHAFWPRSEEIDRLRVMVVQLSLCVLAQSIDPIDPFKDKPC